MAYLEVLIMKIRISAAFQCFEPKQKNQTLALKQKDV